MITLLVMLPAAPNGPSLPYAQGGLPQSIGSQFSLRVRPVTRRSVPTGNPKRMAVTAINKGTTVHTTGTGGMYGEDCSSARAQLSTDPATVYVLTVTPGCAPVGASFDVVATPGRAIAVTITGEPHGWPCAGACRVGVTNGGGDVHINVSILEVRLTPTLCIAPDHTKWIYWGIQTACPLRPGNPNYVAPSWTNMYGGLCYLIYMGVPDNPVTVEPSCARVGAHGTTFHIQGLYGDRALHVHLSGKGNAKTCWGECDVVLRDGGGRVVVDGPTHRGYLYPTLCIAPDHAKWIYWGTQTACSLRPGNPNYVPQTWTNMYGNNCPVAQTTVADNPASVTPSCARVGAHGTTFHIQGLYGDRALHVHLSGKGNTKTCWGECDVALRNGGGSVIADGPTKRGYLYPTLCIAPDHAKWIYWSAQMLCPKGAVVGPGAPGLPISILSPDIKVIAYIHPFDMSSCVRDLESNPYLMQRADNAGYHAPLVARVNVWQSCTGLATSANPVPPNDLSGRQWNTFKASHEYRGYIHIAPMRVTCTNGQVTQVILPQQEESSLGYTKVFGVFDLGDEYLAWRHHRIASR